ncbi:MAG: MBL fold metallo-hydrolase [Bacteroidetes bacterium]|nr:MBL fold metallo-hydrolase [Bacteroidota bacterium]
MKTLIILFAIAALSINVNAQISLESYKPVLQNTLDRSINVSSEKGYAIQEVKPNIYVITDGIWQSAAIVTSDGVVLIDAPESFGQNIQKAVAEVTDKSITTLIYSHGHLDHIGGSHYLSDIKNLEIISLAKVADFLREKNDSKRLIPNRTFEGALVLKKGDKQIYLSNHMNYHSNEGDLFISVPQDKFLMAIDVLAPGYVPFKNLDITMNVNDYMKVFDQILAYDFDVFIGGHLTSVGNRNDILETKAYVQDLYETVKRIHSNTNMMQVMSSAAEKIGWNNKYLLFQVFLDKIIDESAEEIEARWINRLAGVDVFAKSHAATMLLYVRWDD